MIGNKIADKITSISKKKPVTELRSKELSSNNNNNNDNKKDVEINTHKKRYISPKERQKIIDELRLVPKKDACF